VATAVHLFAHPFATQTGDVVFVMDAVLTPVFLADFLYRFFTARSRTRYFLTGLGWVDLLSVVPGLRIVRIVRVVQVVRWLRRKGGGEVVEELAEQRATATFLVTVFLVFVVVEVAGASIFAVESGDPNANIRTAGDALWWGLVTITTVGYGDRVPVTPGGRVIGVFLLFSGIALFSVLTGFIANVFLAPRHRRLRHQPRDDSRAAIASLRELLADQEERTDQIRQRLDDLERSLRPGANAGTSGAIAEEAAE
jgi:voltage-gated potassium channel Kch